MDKLKIECDYSHILELIDRDLPEGLTIRFPLDDKSGESNESEAQNAPQSEEVVIIDPEEETPDFESSVTGDPLFWMALITGVASAGIWDALKFIFIRTAAQVKQHRARVRINGIEIPHDQFEDQHRFKQFTIGSLDIEKDQTGE